MKCPLCGYEKTHKHGLTSFGSQRYFCTKCRQSFTDTFDTLYYRRQVSEEDVRIVLQAHAEGSSLRGIGRISGLAYDTVASIVQAAAHKAQIVQPKYKVSIRMPLLRMSCGHLWKKTKTLLTTRARSWRLLDSRKFGTVKWFDSHWSCGQAYRRVGAGTGE